MGNRITVFAALLLCLVGRAAAADDAPLLAHAPTLSKAQVVFEYGGYLWSVAREGGEARQLTTGGHEKLPYFRRMEAGSRSPGSTMEILTCS